jgi:hypothetical protein
VRNSGGNLFTIFPVGVNRIHTFILPFNFKATDYVEVKGLQDCLTPTDQLSDRIVVDLIIAMIKYIYSKNSSLSYRVSALEVKRPSILTQISVRHFNCS